MLWQLQQVDSCHRLLCGALNGLPIMQQFWKGVCRSNLCETGFQEYAFLECIYVRVFILRG